MRDLLRDSLSRSLRELSDEDRLAAAWSVACGPALAGHGELLQLDHERVLHVRVASQLWMQQFLHMRSALANDLARIAGVSLSSIRFDLPAPPPRPPRRPASKA
ncbi:DciA family protein [Granulicella sp. 5B5]|uniref:DciA family protein n=1 Tax=Granulicella sp. 5B5 TaxID=1617967 RepID=UPI0021068506|nr:DciA family protein [Granulicella sp. 5B5]